MPKLNDFLVILSNIIPGKTAILQHWVSLACSEIKPPGRGRECWLQEYRAVLIQNNNKNFIIKCILQNQSAKPVFQHKNERICRLPI